MLNDIESKFVNDYILKAKRDRLLFELGSDKKREKALARFSHEAEEIFDSKKIIYCGVELTAGEAIDFFKEKKIKNFYVVSSSQNDKIVLAAEMALNYCFSEYMPVILIGEDYAFVKCEVELGASKRIILHR